MGFYKYYYYVCKKGGNMKRILSLLAVLLALSAYAEHEYIPYVEEGKVWVSFEVSSSSYKQVGIGELTEINNKLYHKLYISILDAITNEITYAGLHGYIREENKKVFTRELNNEFETMIYDFDIQAGDTIQFQQGETIVDSIETQIYYGKERHVFYVTHESSQINDIWIEGVGSQEFPIMLSLIPNFGASGMMFYEYSYNYNTEEIFPTNKTPRAEFSYPGEKYIPCLQEGNAWVFENTPPGELVQRHIGSTKVIDGVEYHVLYKTIFYPQSWSAGEPIEAGYMREENGKVYMGAGENEKLIIDFTLQKGDTAYWDTDKHVYIKDVSYSVIAGKERKVMQVETRGFGPEGETTNKETWIEGIGTTHNIFDAESYRWYDLSGLYTRFKYFYNYPTQTCYPENAEQFDFGTQSKYEYIPFLSPSNEWVEYGYQHYMQYTVGEMVELYGKNYYTINETELSLPDQVISHSKHKSYYREEDKKLYMLNVDEDFLVFDFGANAGDTVTLKPFFENEVRKIIIDSIQSTTLTGKVRDIYYVDYGYETDVWIEGIGPIHSFLFNEGIRWGGVGYSYFHYYYDNSTQYVYPEDRDVLDFSAVHSLQAEAHTLTLHRNGNALMAVFPTASAGESITLYDTTGRVVATQAVQQGATTATIDITALPAGVYIARLNSGATAKMVW